MGFFMMNWWTFRNTILLWYHFVCCTFSSEIYVYLKPWILSSRNICPVPMLCAGIFLKDSLLHVWLNATLQYYLWHGLCLYYSALDLLLTRRLHYWVLHDVNYIHRACSPGTWYFMRVCVVFLRDVMTFTYYVLSRNFIFMYVMPYISIWCQLYLHTTRCPGTWYFMPDSVVYFYVMSLILIYCELSRNLIFYARQCCIFLRDVIGVHLLWALGELEILCASVSFVNDMISSHTPVVARNIHVILMLFIYQHFVQHRCALLCWVTVHISIVDFHTECVYFDEHGAEFLWWPPGVGRLYLNVNMSKHQRKLNEKGLGLLERNLRGKCASAIRAANKVVNKLIPLLKSDNSDFEPVKEYSVELHQYIALIVDTQEEFDSKFAGHLEILASFGEWLQPRFDVLKSVLEYSTAWIDSTTTMSEVPSGAGILPIDNDIEPEDSISQLSAARSRSDRHSNASSKSRSRVSKSSSSSHVSSIKSARVKESLKKVTLMAEARNLVERQSLLRKEFELSMEKQSLDLSTNLAIATAKEEILLNAELDNDNMAGSCVSEVRSKPVGTGPSVCSSVKPEGLLTDDPSVHLSTKGDKVTDVADMSIVTGQLSNISVSVLPVHPSVCDSVVQPVCRMVETDTTSLAARTLSSATSDTVHFPLRSGEGLQSRGLGKCHVAQADSRMHHSTPSVSTTPSFCHGSGTKMTVVCGDQVAQPHLDTGADRQKSSSTPVGGSGELLQASVGTSRCGLNPSSPVFRPRYSDVQQVNGAGDSVHFPHVVDRSDCLRPGFQDGFLDGAVGSRFVDRVPGDYGTGVGLRNEIKVESAFDKLADVLRDQRHRLPELSVPKFGGDPLEYVSFIRSFDSRVASRTTDEREKLYFLEQFTTGTPREIVRSCIMMPSWLGYVEARRRLDERFGNPFVLGQCYLKRLEKWPSISRDDVKRLDDFTTFLIGCRNAMTATESIKELDYPTSLRLIVSKLPGYLQDRWARVADKTLYHEGNLVTFNKLVEFLESENRIRLNPVFGKAALSSTDRNKGGASNQNRKVTSAGTVAKTTSDKTPAPHSVSMSESLCMFCELPHSFITCRKFRKILHKDNISFLMKHRLCFDCLGRDHMRSQCSQRATCEVCKGAHPTLLHRSRAGTDQSGVNSPVPGADSASVSTAVDQSRSSASGVPAVTSAAVKRCHTILETMPIVPVRVKSVFGDKECCTYAFLDSGSSDTLMTEHLMRDLGVCGKRTTINLTTLNADSVPSSCFAVSNLEVCGLNESVFVPLPVVFTQESMPVSREQVPSQDDINRWTYLSHIAVPALDAEVGILIGNNVPKATEPWEVVNSLGDGPYAVRSLLGWSINGPLRCVSVEDSQCPSVSSCRVQVVCNLDDQLNRFFNLDFSENHVFAEGKGLSVEDRQFLRMTEEGTVFRDGHYEVNLPLQNPTVFVPNNRALAVQRLKSIKKRFVALMCRAVKGLQHSLSKKVGSDPRTFSLSADDLRDAEMTIVRWVQARSFALEMASLESGNGCLTKSNRLAPLDPIIVNGIVRVGGRIGKAPVSDDVKHPVLLPLDSPVSSLLVKKFHEDTGHGGREQVLSRLRQRYWIIHGNALTRRVLKSCVFCRRQFGAPLKQKMADLPLDRITPAEPPFTNTGVDYFGPILVKRGRCQVKRYGALFTCLVSRAVHIEMAASLDTPSFINVLRRFVARRGQVKLMRSDNGTNLVGAQRELRQAIQEWNQAQVEAFLLQKEVTWCFNAPSASHHGGAWERLIRSTRRILLGLTKEQVLDDDGLSTLLAEVESVLNGRPLTKSSSDPQDLTCLTPNHLLLLKDQPSLPPGMFSEADNYVRRRWRQIQYLSDLFWKRWVPEYLTVLQDRQKWLFPKRNVQVNDVVLIVDQGAPRGSWLLGRVIETYPDKNGYVRNVAMKTRSSRLVRPVSKLVMVLECDE